MDANQSPVFIFPPTPEKLNLLKQIAPGQIWRLSHGFYCYLHSYQTSAKQDEVFWRSQDLPEYVMIVREPDAVARVAVMPLSPRTELVNELDLLLPATVSNLDRDFLIETWHTFLIPASYLAHPVELRFSYATYSLLMDVGDTYYQVNASLPSAAEIEAHGLRTKQVSTEQRKIEQFREQEELWSGLLELPVEEHYQYLKDDQDSKILLRLTEIEPKPDPEPSQNTYLSNTPLIQNCFGRTPELKKLKKWVVEDRCKVITISGTGGIGKTALAASLAEQVKSHFNYVIWQPLQNAPKLHKIAADIIEFLTEGRKSKDETEPATDQILKYLTTYRCLVIFDGFDEVLAEQSDPLDESYAHLLTHLQQANHQSCLIVTSRAETEPQLAQTLSLRGLPLEAGTEILKAEGIESTKTELLSQYYDGNPLALKLAATLIKETFNNEIDTFLKSTEPEAGVQGMLKQQFQQFSDLEKIILYWFAINRVPVSVEQLHHDISRPIARDEVLNTLEFLERRLLLEKNGEEYTLPPLIMDYVTERLIKRVCQEIQTQAIKLFNSHALVKAQSQNYIQQCQRQKILQPILDQLGQSPEALEDRLMQILDNLRVGFTRKPGYAASNVIAVLRQIRPEALPKKDFSKLSMRQADFRGLDFTGADLSYSDLENAIFTKTLNSILAIAFHPDGQRIATGDKSGYLRIWQIPDGELLSTYRHRGGWLRSVSFSPDGRTVAGAGDARTIRIWDLETGKCLRILLGHSDSVRSISFSHDGRQIISASDDQTLKLWDVKTGQCEHTFLGHTARIRCVLFSPDDSMIASTGDDQTVRLWHREQGNHEKALLGHTDVIFSIAFAPDSQSLASASQDCTIRLWDVAAGTCYQILREHQNPIRSVAFSPDGQIIASGSIQGNLRLWDAKTAKQIRVLNGHTSWVRALAFSPNGRLLASGSSDHTLKLWNPETKRCFRSLQGYACRVWSVAIHPQGWFLATANEDHKVRLWDGKKGKCLATLSGHRDWVRSVHFSPDGRFLASGAHDKTVQVWQLEAYESIEQQTPIVLKGHTHRVRVVRFSPDGRILATGGHDQTILLWDLDTHRSFAKLEAHQGCVRSLSFSSNGQLLISCSPDRSIRIWDVAQQQCVQVITDEVCRLSTVRFHPSGQWFASGGEDGIIRLWDVKTATVIRRFEGHRRWVQSVSFDCDGNYLVSGSEDQTVRVWNVYTGGCEVELVGHENWVRSVAFSPDGQWVYSGGEDEVVRVWNWRERLRVDKLPNPKPYDRMNITGVVGLSPSEKSALVKLGAIDVDSCG